MSFRFDDLRIFAEKRFLGLFSAAYPAIPLQFGNAPFKQPATGPWARFIIKTAKSFPASLGNRFVERTTGYFEIQGFAREADETFGDADAKKLVETGIGFFQYGNFQTLSGIVRCCEIRPPDDLGKANGVVRYAGRVFFEYDVQIVRPT